MMTELAMPDCSYACRIDAYYDQELDPLDRASVEEHLAQCPHCRQELASLQRLSSRFFSIPTDELSHRELNRLYTVSQSAPQAKPLLPFAVGLMAAAASLLVVCSAWLSEVPPAVAPTRVAVLDEGADWEKYALMGPNEAPSPLGDQTAVAEVNLADLMLYGLSDGGKP
jgi:anti-sigma factor RsiW